MLKFSAALKKAVSSGKVGESAFKPNEEGCYFNAFPSIAETLKQIEDAIVASGANGTDESRPASSLQAKPKTAESKGRKDVTTPAPEESKEPQVSNYDWTARKAFRIGVNCDSEALFNKDPKEPNKYEVEGQKVPLASPQLVDYLVKLCAEHPLITYLEDPVANEDFDGMSNLQQSIAEKGLAV